MTERNILLVDANEHNLYAFNLFLEGEGFHIIHRRSEAEIIDAVERGQLTAAFIDMSRAENSHDGCIISRLINIAPELPIILLCSVPPPEIFTLPEKHPNIFILEKPLSINEIRKILKEKICD